ncbi:TetR family transcriptional regulator, partial [Rhizobium ruizarguesonis]
MAAKRSGAKSKRYGRRGASHLSGQEPRSEPPLSLERIVATAVDLMDAEGVDGLKMRRLADRLGSG